MGIHDPIDKKSTKAEIDAKRTDWLSNIRSRLGGGVLSSQTIAPIPERKSKEGDWDTKKLEEEHSKNKNREDVANFIESLHSRRAGWLGKEEEREKAYLASREDLKTRLANLNNSRDLHQWRSELGNFRDTLNQMGLADAIIGATDLSEVFERHKISELVGNDPELLAQVTHLLGFGEKAAKLQNVLATYRDLELPVDDLNLEEIIISGTESHHEFVNRLKERIGMFGFYYDDIIQTEAALEEYAEESSNDTDIEIADIEATIVSEWERIHRDILKNYGVTQVVSSSFDEVSFENLYLSLRTMAYFTTWDLEWFDEEMLYIPFVYNSLGKASKKLLDAWKGKSYSRRDVFLNTMNNVDIDSLNKKLYLQLLEPKHRQRESSKKRWDKPLGRLNTFRRDLGIELPEREFVEQMFTVYNEMLLPANGIGDKRSHAIVEGVLFMHYNAHYSILQSKVLGELSDLTKEFFGPDSDQYAEAKEILEKAQDQDFRYEMRERASHELC